MSTLAEVRAQINAIPNAPIDKSAALSLVGQGIAAIDLAIVHAGDDVFGGILPGERTRKNVREALYYHRDQIEGSYYSDYLGTEDLKNDVMRAYYELSAVGGELPRFISIMSPRQLVEDFKTSAQELADKAIPVFQWGTVALVGAGLIALALAIGAKRVTA